MPQSQIISEAAKSYDPRRLQATVPYYERYRLGYPDLLIRHVIGRTGLRSGDMIIDFGCGPGLVAIPFAKLGMNAVIATRGRPA